MTFSEKYIDRFIYPPDKLDLDRIRKGRLFIYSLLFLSFLVTAATPIIVVTSKEQAFFSFIFNAVFLLVVAAMFYIHKHYGKRTLLANCIAVLMFGPFIETYHVTGGIYSSDNVTMLIIISWVFLVADKRSGIVFSFLYMGLWVFMYMAEKSGRHDFIGDFLKQPAEYALFNYMISGIFMLIIFYLFEKGKEKFIAQIVQGKAEIETQKKELESKNKDITDSVNYAKKIQLAVLPNEETIERSIPLSFILYKPKDIVSGDFFWFHEIDRDNYIIVCADCTGHGVPGAMMTVIGSNLLNQIVIDNKITQPSQILLVLDNFINVTLKQQKEHEHLVQDGMDLALLKVDKAKKEFIFTSAKRPALFIRDKQLQEFKGSKSSLGGMITDCKTFQETKINYKEDNILYFYTDGYTDQFGGPKGKKFSSKQLKETLFGMHRSSMNEQKQRLESTINNWKGNLEQVDDILVMGIRF